MQQCLHLLTARYQHGPCPTSPTLQVAVSSLGPALRAVLRLHSRRMLARRVANRQQGTLVTTVDDGADSPLPADAAVCAHPGSLNTVGALSLLCCEFAGVLCTCAPLSLSFVHNSLQSWLLEMNG
jgi:hypothetical protein